MTAAAYNLTIEQGSDFAIQLTLSEEGAPKNLTGYSGRAQMRAKKTDASPAASFTVDVLDATLGILKMTMSNATTTNVAPGLYFYDLELHTALDGVVSRLLEGQVTVTAEVTR
jgi:hypothetical protein